MKHLLKKTIFYCFLLGATTVAVAQTPSTLTIPNCWANPGENIYFTLSCSKTFDNPTYVLIEGAPYGIQVSYYDRVDDKMSLTISVAYGVSGGTYNIRLMGQYWEGWETPEGSGIHIVDKPISNYFILHIFSDQNDKTKLIAVTPIDTETERRYEVKTRNIDLIDRVNVWVETAEFGTNPFGMSAQLSVFYLDEKGDGHGALNFNSGYAPSGAYPVRIVYNDAPYLVRSNEFDFIVPGPSTTFYTVFESAGITIYPNPAQNSFFIECENISTVKLYDMLGQEILTQPANGKTEINISHLPKGIYIVKILSEGKMIGNSKIVKQ